MGFNNNVMIVLIRLILNFVNSLSFEWTTSLVHLYFSLKSKTHTSYSQQNFWSLAFLQFTHIY